jgi:hypothetical protein
MSDPNDDGSCFALAYHHCVPGRDDPNGVPAHIRGAKRSALDQVYGVQRGCTHKDAKGRTYPCFQRAPQDWTSVCVARPETAGRGKCAKVTRDEWRAWVQADDPSRTSDCQFPTLYVKSHFRGDKIMSQYTGKHGRG